MRADPSEFPAAAYWSPYSLARAANPYDDLTVVNFGTLRIYWGTDSQTADPNLSSSGNQYGEQHPDYKGVCYCVLIDWLFGRERTSAPNIELVVARKPNQTIVTGDPALLNDGQANLAAAAAELLTSQNGLGLASSLLDSTRFQSVADELDDNADLAACSPLLNSQQTVAGFLADLSLIADARFAFSPATGKIEAIVHPCKFIGVSPQITK